MTDRTCMYPEIQKAEDYTDPTNNKKNVERRQSLPWKRAVKKSVSNNKSLSKYYTQQIQI